MMFGCATRSTPSLLPAPIHYSHRLLDHPQRIRKRGDIGDMQSDAKTLVPVLHESGVPTGITTVLISH